MHEHAEQDHDDPTAGTVAFVGAVSVILLIATVLATQALFYRTATLEEERKVISEQPQELRQVRTDQLELLNGYRWVDESKGVVAIPIDRAMELAAEEARRKPER